MIDIIKVLFNIVEAFVVMLGLGLSILILARVFKKKKDLFKLKGGTKTNSWQ